MLLYVKHVCVCFLFVCLFVCFLFFVFFLCSLNVLYFIMHNVSQSHVWCFLMSHYIVCFYFHFWEHSFIWYFCLSIFPSDILWAACGISKIRCIGTDHLILVVSVGGVWFCPGTRGCFFHTKNKTCQVLMYIFLQ